MAPRVAEITGDAPEVFATAENVAVVLPAVTVTLAGTDAAEGIELARLTTTPPAGAATESVTVPVALEPGRTTPGLRVRDVNVGFGPTVSVAVFEVAPKVAVIVTFVDEATVEVETVKVAELWPWATTTLAGTVATAVPEEVRLTASPPAGAVPVRVTVPVDGKPPTTEVGLRET